MKYRVGISRHANGVDGWVFDLPGCVCASRDDASLRELLPVVIAEHVAWLRRHDEPTSEGALSMKFDVVEEVVARECGAADGEFVFGDDLRPVTTDEIATAVRHMEYARCDLLALTAPIPDIVLDWRPSKSAMARIDPWNPDVHTIREIVADIASSEGYYRRGLCDGREVVEPDGEAGPQLEAQRALTIARLQGLPEQERGKVFRPVRSWQDRSEEWTARKAFRRIISHERFHTKEIEQRVAWLLLGVPDFSTSVTASAEGVATHA